PLRTKQAIDVHGDDIKKHITMLDTNAFTAETDAKDYPLGISYFYVDSNSQKFPAQHVFITTIKEVLSDNQFRLFQTVKSVGVDYGRIWTRGTRSGAWGPWEEWETTDGAQQKINVHEAKKNNPHNVTKAQVGLGNVPNWGGASQTDARGGTNNSTIMTPLRTKEAIDAFVSQATIISAISGTVSGNDYPSGLTTFEHSNLSGYPTSHGTIFNIKVSNIRFTQWYFPHSIRHEEIGAYFRHFYGGDGWTPWQKVSTYEEVIVLIDEHAERTDNPHKVTSQQVNIISPRRADVPGSDYPTGVTLFAQSNGIENGYPVNMAVVETRRVENYRMTQTCCDASGSPTVAIWERKWRPDLPGTGWSDWEQTETASGAQAKVDAHANDKGNPHSVTKAQVGLANVDNAKQATKAEFDAHLNNKSNPHGVTKSQVGLGNVPNYPIASQAQAEAGNHTESFMTPQRVRQFAAKYGPDYDEFNGIAAGLGSHISDKSNPHGVT
ncbi:pyocin knob domain-containing protein, partial [Shouchella clausii]|uniref:pyocin knob domain-containing protein n=1 Tax=Shouchella clausii TaxID=79880 RepID=UPI000BCCE79B